ncbi:hypothetical protein ABE41_012375 [Fictibacillus arsenicus]|uniref:Uncharacterized protein n=1 Tax=Fictibacillus arsenicus TaxID=255247 RepID=A0A1B1Z5T3_9BACL|nr:hypothetical protein [Fictibacillus arsenicus]ANX12808.1 hypothetical protein ABE41_012375 [Fictibacillus arsenicus]
MLLRLQAKQHRSVFLVAALQEAYSGGWHAGVSHLTLHQQVNEENDLNEPKPTIFREEPFKTYLLVYVSE